MRLLMFFGGLELQQGGVFDAENTTHSGSSRAPATYRAIEDEVLPLKQKQTRLRIGMRSVDTNEARAASVLPSRSC